MPSRRLLPPTTSSAALEIHPDNKMGMAKRELVILFFLWVSPSDTSVFHFFCVSLRREVYMVRLHLTIILIYDEL